MLLALSSHHIQSLNDFSKYLEMVFDWFESLLGLMWEIGWRYSGQMLGLNEQQLQQLFENFL